MRNLLGKYWKQMVYDAKDIHLCPPPPVIEGVENHLPMQDGRREKP